MAFATADDLNSILGETIDEERAELVLGLATGLIRGWTRQILSLVEDDTVVFPANWETRLQLPERPVVSISSVTVDDTALTADDWTLAGDTLTRVDGLRWGDPDSTVTVVYTHGYDPIPDDLRAFCLRIASRYLVNPQGLRTESIGTYSVGFGGDITGATVAESEWRELSRYRLRAAALPI